MCVCGCEKARVVDRRCDRIDRSIVFRAIIEQAMLLHDAAICSLYTSLFQSIPLSRHGNGPEDTRGDSS